MPEIDRVSAKPPLTRSQCFWGTGNAVAAAVFVAASIVAFVTDRAGNLDVAWSGSLVAMFALGAADYLVWREEPPTWMQILQGITVLTFAVLTVARIL